MGLEGLAGRTIEKEAVMPIWTVAFYDERYDFEPSRRGAVKAASEGEAFEIVKDIMGLAERADLTPAIVRDEPSFPEGYRDLI